MQHLLNSLGLSQRDVARGAGMAKTSVHRLCAKGQWPKLREIQARRRLAQFFVAKGATPDQVAFITAPLTATSDPANELAPSSCELPEAAPVAPVITHESPKEDHMLLRNESLTPDARRHFGIPRSPFTDDVQSRDDVFTSPDIRFARAALKDAANNHGFIALIGESGAGKSTLVEDLEESLKGGTDEIVMVKPYTLAMELNDIRGKTLKSGSIAEALIKALDSNASLTITPQARFQQLHQLLKASSRAGRKHLLIMEEAHCLPVSTLKHLKRFLELKDGLRRLLGIALIGQPELAERLSSQNAEVREVMQRCEVITLQPLDNDLEAYLAHKFKRFDLTVSDVFTADAMDAIRARLIRIPRGGRQVDAVSLCYPLVVNNLCCRAMNACARNGWPKVDAKAVAGC